MFSLFRYLNEWNWSSVDITNMKSQQIILLCTNLFPWLHKCPSLFICEIYLWCHIWQISYFIECLFMEYCSWISRIKNIESLSRAWNMFFPTLNAHNATNSFLSWIKITELIKIQVSRIYVQFPMESIVMYVTPEVINQNIIIYTKPFACLMAMLKKTMICRLQVRA